MRVYIAYLVEGEAAIKRQQLLRNLARDLNYHYALPDLRKPAHITLKNPFEFEEIEGLRRVLREYASKQRESEMRLEGVRCFDLKSRVIFYQRVRISNQMVKSFHGLVDLLESIPEVTWSDFDGRRKELHLTLVKAGSNKRFKQIADYLERNDPSRVTLKFDHVALLGKKEGQTEVIERFQFSKT